MNRVPVNKRQSPTKEQLLAACPTRLVDAQPKDDGEGKWRLQVPLRTARWAIWFLRAPEVATKTFELDALGKGVWDTCDGRTSVRRIIERLAGEYHLNQREAEVATIAFLNTLSRKGLIGMEVE
jgi:hypothetical protein